MTSDPRKPDSAGKLYEMIDQVQNSSDAAALAGVLWPMIAAAQLGAASPEPVAWRWRYDNQFWAFRSTRPKHADDVDVTCEPLYTHPPASPPTGDDCSCGGGDISGHDALCPERSQEATEKKP